MQNFYWSKEFNASILERLNKLINQLKSHVNNKIAWEIALIELMKTSPN